MSIWYCPAHGVYGGQITCPECGFQGSYVTFEEPVKPAEQPENIEAGWNKVIGSKADPEKAEVDALVKRMTETVRRHKEKRRAEEPMELSTEKCGTIQS